jgi:hypothetical protein
VRAEDLVLPRPAESAFLRGALTGDWSAWRADEPWTPRLGALAPIARAPGAPQALRPVLHAAALREERRAAAVQQIAGGVLEALAAAGVRAAPIRGIALAELAWPVPARRHTHELELLVDRPPPPLGERALAVRVTQVAEVDGAPGRIAGAPCVLLSRQHLLVDACASGVLEPHRPPLWVADVWFALRAWDGLDAAGLASAARSSTQARAAAVGLEHLARSLGAPVPPGAVAALAARGAAPEARDALVAAAWRAGRARGERLPTGVLLRWAVRPSAAYLRAAGGRPGSAPALYVRRAAGFARWKARR